jgi:tripartite-type tricarboxylate transporter receptor subunit TctC
MSGDVASDRVRILATDGARRSPLLPNVPTFAEVGLGDFPLNAWWGLTMPAGTPDAIVQRLNEAIVEAFRGPKMTEFMNKNYLESGVSDPATFGAFLTKDRARAAELVKRYNIPKQ